MLDNGNTGMTGTGEAGVTSQAGIAECCSASAGLLRLLRQSGFVGVWPSL